MTGQRLLHPASLPTTVARQYTDLREPFASGLRPEQDHLLTGLLPEDGEARETMNVWFYDGQRDIGFNIHAGMFDGEMAAPVTMFLPGGRILRIRSDQPAKFGDGSRPHSLRVSYTCEQPFRAWRFAIDALPVWETSDGQLAAGTIADETPTTTVSLSASAEMVSPAYLQGAMLPEAAAEIAGEPGLWFACRVRAGLTPEAFRYDQMFHATGTITFEGVEYPFDGYGLRGHVRGVRALGKMAGHTWLAGAFPSGTAFAIQTFPRPEGGYFFSEGYLFRDGMVYPNRVIHAPRFNPDADEPGFVVELACDQLGLTRIEGRDRRLFWWSMAKWGDGQPPRWGFDPAAGMVMRQGVTEYRLDGETGYGMCERSGAP